MPVTLNCCAELKSQSRNTHQLIEIHSKDIIQNDFCSYLIDESRIPIGNAQHLYFPFDEYQLVSILSQTFRQKEPVTISGARTGLVGGAVPNGGTLISFERMNQVLNFNINQDTASITIQPGLTLADLNGFLDNKTNEWFYAPDPTEKTASLGGNVATNASGSRSLKYGQTRKHIQKLRVVLCDGTVLEIKRGQFQLQQNEVYIIKGKQYEFQFSIPYINSIKLKNTAGYFIYPDMDLIDLFIGSEGTLGVFSEIEMSLSKRPETDFAALAFFQSESNAIQFVSDIRSKTQLDLINPTAIEYFDSNSLDLLREQRKLEHPHSEIPDIPESVKAVIYFEQECTENTFEAFYDIYDQLLQKNGTCMDETWGGISIEEIRQLNKFRHALPETVNSIIGQKQKSIPEIYKISTDFVVEDDQLIRMMEIYYQKLWKSNLHFVIFGHIGENHLHVNMIPNNKNELQRAKEMYMELAREAVHLGGTISGEHGIGKLKKHLLPLMFSEKVMQQFYQLKRSFDPFECLEKGVIF